jgi:hypothetical protein
MTNRAQRRAAERQAQKLAVKASKVMSATASFGGSDQPAPPITFESTPPILTEDAHETISHARLNANRANAQRSTGPRTEEGKAKSSMNAIKTGLTGRTVLLPTDDVPAYERHTARLMADFSPATETEKSLVQNIADTEWRLLRIPQLEASIYAIGSLELADQFPDHAPQPANREALILGKIFLTYRKDLTNLALQERRLRNQRKDDLAELRELQRARVENLKASKRHRTDQLSRASQLSSDCAKKRVPFDPVTFGFDFSKEEYAHYRQCSEENYAKFGRDVDFDELMAAYRAAQKEPQAA